MKSLSAIALMILAGWLAYKLYQLPCKVQGYQAKASPSPTRVIGPYQDPAAYEYRPPDKENKYGENDLEVQTRIANSREYTLGAEHGEIREKVEPPFPE